MKKNKVALPKAPRQASRRRASPAQPGLIHPIVVYPFRQPSHYADLSELYHLIARLDGDRGTYARPITVIDHKTRLANERDRRFRDFPRPHRGPALGYSGCVVRGHVPDVVYGFGRGF